MVAFNMETRWCGLKKDQLTPMLAAYAAFWNTEHLNKLHLLQTILWSEVSFYFIFQLLKRAILSTVYSHSPRFTITQTNTY